MASNNELEPGIYEQTRVLEVFAYAGLTCAHTSNELGGAQWWHLWNATGHCLGSANNPALLGDLIRAAN